MGYLSVGPSILNFERGYFEITGTIPQTSSVSFTSSLGREDYNHGHAMISRSPSGSASQYTGHSALVYFTNAEADSASQATNRVVTQFQGYYGTEYTFINSPHKGYFKKLDGFLSEAVFGSTGESVRINSCYISGSKLLITLYNTNAAVARDARLQIEYRIWKT